MRTVFYDVWSPQIFVVCGVINCNSEWYIAVPGFSLVVHSMSGYDNLDGVNWSHSFGYTGPAHLIAGSVPRKCC